MCNIKNKDIRTKLVQTGLDRNENENPNLPSSIRQGYVDPPLVMSQSATKTVDRCGHEGLLFKITFLWVLRHC